MRKIIYFSTQNNSTKTIKSAAKTWGELKQEIGGNFSDMKLTIKETRTSIEGDTSVLPKGEFTLFSFPAKSKSGEYSEAQIKEMRTKLNKMFDQFLGETSAPATKKAATKVATKKAAPATSKNSKLAAEAAKLKKDLGL